MRTTLIFLFLLSLASPSFASDHIDGPITKRHAVTDLTDFFAFPTPNKPGYLSLILNAYPAVGSKNHFPDRAEYSFYVRKASLAKNVANTDSRSQIKITCSFETPADHSKHRVNCETNNGLSATNLVDKTEGSTGDFKLFAGQRSDPFFFDALWTIKLSKGVVAPAIAGDSMSRLNVLSIIVEVEASKLFADASLLAVAADVRFNGERLDFVGRPEVTNVGMQASGEELRDRYNQEEPFSRTKEFKDFYIERLRSNMGAYDLLDSKQDLSAAEFDATIALIADDYLLLDITKPCKRNGYFVIETALVKSTKYNTCGGRHPNDDVMDQIFSLFVTGNYQPGADGKFAWGDRVDSPHKDVSDSFPYLAEPSRGTRARAKAKLFRELFKL